MTEHLPYPAVLPGSLRATIDQGVAKFQLGVHFDAFSIRNKTKFETKWPCLIILHFEIGIKISAMIKNLKKFKKKFWSIGQRSKFFDIDFDQFWSKGQWLKFFKIYFEPFWSRNDLKGSKFSWDGYEISENFISKKWPNRNWSFRSISQHPAID